MKRSFKPQVETLESRLVMDAVGTHALCQDLVVPTAPTTSEIGPVVSPNLSSFAGQTIRLRIAVVNNSGQDAADTHAVSGRITAIVADPSDAQSTAIDNEWRYVPVRRFVSVDEPQGSAIAFVGGWGSSMYQYSFSDPASGIGSPGEVLAGTDSGDARSAHHGGLNFHLSDGSVRFVSTAIAANGMNVLLGDASARSCNANNDDATLPMSLDGEASSMSRPNPGKMNWEHYFDTAATAANENGHGTHVAGTIGAVGNNALSHELGHWQGLMTGR